MIDFKDICLVPSKTTRVCSRDSINIKDEKGFLPIMAAPMDTVVSVDNMSDYLSNGIIPCLPRETEDLPEMVNENIFVSMSLTDFEYFVDDYKKTNGKDIDGNIKILVDVANGHMECLMTAVQEFLILRNGFGKQEEHQIMVGNIANSKTYEEYAKMGVDYVRVGIGGGSACLTSANVGVHYPMVPLLMECRSIKVENNYTAKIVADGGFKNYDDIIKALALGADYVMLGGIFNKCIESCGQTSLFKCIEISQPIAEDLWFTFPFIRKFMYKSFRGMSTKEVQRSWKNKKIRTSEGIVKTNKVMYSLHQWVENFESYLKSAMSYTNSLNLNEFKTSDYMTISPNTLNRFEK